MEDNYVMDSTIGSCYFDVKDLVMNKWTKKTFIFNEVRRPRDAKYCFFFAPIIWVTWDHNSFVFRIQHSLVELYLAIKAKILLSKVALKLFLEVKCVSFQENAKFLN